MKGISQDLLDCAASFLAELEGNAAQDDSDVEIDETFFDCNDYISHPGITGAVIDDILEDADGYFRPLGIPASNRLVKIFLAALQEYRSLGDANNYMEIPHFWGENLLQSIDVSLPFYVAPSHLQIAALEDFIAEMYDFLQHYYERSWVEIKVPEKDYRKYKQNSSKESYVEPVPIDTNVNIEQFGGDISLEDFEPAGTREDMALLFANTSDSFEEGRRDGLIGNTNVITEPHRRDVIVESVDVDVETVESDTPSQSSSAHIVRRDITVLLDFGVIRRIPLRQVNIDESVYLLKTLIERQTSFEVFSQTLVSSQDVEMEDDMPVREYLNDDEDTVTLLLDESDPMFEEWSGGF